MITTLIGDIGGQVRVFKKVLDSLDLDSKYRLPPGHRVIQVGDLVRISPKLVQENYDVVKLAMKVVQANPENWIQLVGNHECAALGGPSRNTWDVRGSVSSSCWEILNHLWTSKLCRLATRCNFYGQDVLVSHAGLTWQRWLTMGRPPLRQTITALNLNVGIPFSDFAMAGSLVNKDLNPMADTLWAEVNWELYMPWYNAGHMPFSQIHGHASPFNWPSGHWWPDTPQIIRDLTSAHTDLRSSFSIIDASRNFLMSIDWALGDESTDTVWPLLVLCGENGGPHEQ